MYQKPKNNVDVDLSFVEQYDKEMSKFGTVRDSSARTINEWVRMAADATDLYADYEGILHDYDYDVVVMNDHTLEVENFTREQMARGELPAYMDDKLYDESELGKEDHDGNIERAYESLYGAAYHVDDILASSTRQFLGPKYETYRMERALEEQAARIAELAELKASQNGMKSTFIDKETGESYLSLVGPDGESTEDPYAFDEPC